MTIASVIPQNHFILILWEAYLMVRSKLTNTRKMECDFLARFKKHWHQHQHRHRLIRMFKTILTSSKSAGPCPHLIEMYVIQICWSSADPWIMRWENIQILRCITIYYLGNLSGCTTVNFTTTQIAGSISSVDHAACPDTMSIQSTQSTQLVLEKHKANVDVDDKEYKGRRGEGRRGREVWEAEGVTERLANIVLSPTESLKIDQTKIERFWQTSILFFCFPGFIVVELWVQSNPRGLEA